LHLPGEKLAKSTSTLLKYTSCCQEGKVILNTVPQLPHVLKELFRRNTEHHAHFMKNIVKYNTALSFASMVHRERTDTGRGPPTFSIQGEIYHIIGNLNGGDQRCFAQIYILDPEEQIASREEFLRNQGPRTDILSELTHLMLEINPYAQQFRMLGLETQGL